MKPDSPILAEHTGLLQVRIGQVHRKRKIYSLRIENLSERPFLVNVYSKLGETSDVLPPKKAGIKTVGKNALPCGKMP
jgi:hypothetical protein